MPGKKPCPGIPAGARADLAVQWPLGAAASREAGRGSAALGMWRVSWAMKSKAEKCLSLPLKYPEVQDFQVTVSCSSSQWIFSSESGGA